mmetsp:Transcript_6958/g.7862  ORF Transcript_6958/g.7862 Transcript_6958/m.7862 type:complete len:319 (+) Transcript_6958:628-1584(+)
MLTGCPPFQAENANKIYEQISACKLRFFESDWEELSAEARQFTKRLIVKNPLDRMTAEESLFHPWIVNSQKLEAKVTKDIIKRLTHFKVPDMLKKEVFLILANQIKNETIQNWTKTFEQLDQDGNGFIDIDALICKCKEEGANTEKLEKLKEMDSEGKNLQINYSSFLAKVIDINSEVTDFDIEKAFKHFDSVNSGRITRTSIIKFLKRKGDESAEKNATILMKEARIKLNQTEEHKNSIISENHEDTTEVGLGLNTFRRYLFSPSALSQSQSKSHNRQSFTSFEKAMSNCAFITPTGSNGMNKIGERMLKYEEHNGV